MNNKHLYRQMWINVHLFFRPQIKSDLLRHIFPPVRLQSHRNKDRHLKETQGGGNKGRSGLVVFVLKNLPEETRQRSGSKLQKKKERIRGRIG